MMITKNKSTSNLTIMNIIMFVLVLLKSQVGAVLRQRPLFNQRMIEYPQLPVTNLGLPLLQQKICYSNNIIVRCPKNDIISNIGRNAQNHIQRAIEKHQIRHQKHDSNYGREVDSYNLDSPVDNLLRNGTYSEYSGRRFSNSILAKLNHLDRPRSSLVRRIKESLHGMPPSASWQDIEITTATTDLYSSTTELIAPDSVDFVKSLDEFERKFYRTTFEKLSSISPASRRENGISFVQSALFLQLALMTFLGEVDHETSSEIEQSLGLQISENDRIEAINVAISSLPTSSNNLKFLWSTRLVLKNHTDILSEQFRALVAPTMQMNISSFNGTESPKEMAEVLNEMVEEDSGNAIHDTFEEEDISDGFQGILLNTLYFRPRWRSAPTLLNGTRRFLDSDSSPQKTVRMIRINDVMRYCELKDWDAEALEIYYSTPGLRLLILVPRSNSLRGLVQHVGNISLQELEGRMRSARIAVTLPLYTLRMTLLLPNKLEAMGIKHLLEARNDTQKVLRLSHAVQRIMFWAEAGRNAYKDDGIEWDEAPEFEMMVDRPYIFYVRWKNKTLMNGNFVL